MKVAQLMIGDRSYYIRPDEVQRVMADAASARDRGEWFVFSDAGRQRMHVLIPSQALLVLHEYEVEDDEPSFDMNDWASFDYDD